MSPDDTEDKDKDNPENADQSFQNRTAEEKRTDGNGFVSKSLLDALKKPRGQKPTTVFKPKDPNDNDIQR